jgi:hypothetical protein
MGAAGTGPGHGLVIIASASSLEADPPAIDRIHTLARCASDRGPKARVYLIADKPVEEDGIAAVELLDGVEYEWLPGTGSAESDVIRQAAVRQTGERLRQDAPGSIATDGTGLAMAVAAALGRAFGIVVDFSTGLPSTLV